MFEVFLSVSFILLTGSEVTCPTGQGGLPDHNGIDDKSTECRQEAWQGFFLPSSPPLNLSSKFGVYGMGLFAPKSRSAQRKD